MEREDLHLQIPPVARVSAALPYFECSDKTFHSPPLPVNDILPHGLFVDLLPPPTTEPAVMDDIALFNGLLKFDHPQAAITFQDYDFLMQCLEDTFPFVDSRLVPLEAVSQYIVDDSASGFPYASTLGSTKGQILAKFSAEQLLHDFMSYSQVLSSTLKVELRPFGKQARLFRPSPVSSQVAGIHLFQYQNDSLQNIFQATPIALGFSSPGLDVSSLWQRLKEFGGSYISLDGSQWDAHFPLFMAQIIRDFRKRHLPSLCHSMVDHYYNEMYCGFTIVKGTPMRIYGNPSGHFNTSTDNSLCEFLMMRLMMHKLHVHPSSTLFFVCGDDLVAATHDPRLTPDNMSAVAVKYGVYYEFLNGSSYSAFDDLVFVGTHPLQTRDGLRYSYDVTKQLSSLHYTTSKASDLDILSKIVSIGCNLYYERAAFEKVRQCALVFINTFLSWSPVVTSLWSVMSDASLNQIYNCYESASCLF